jgi:hypothetical protein
VVVTRVGAGLKIRASCSKEHVSHWESAEFFNQECSDEVP